MVGLHFPKGQHAVPKARLNPRTEGVEQVGSLHEGVDDDGPPLRGNIVVEMPRFAANLGRDDQARSKRCEGTKVRHDRFGTLGPLKLRDRTRQRRVPFLFGRRLKCATSPCHGHKGVRPTSLSICGYITERCSRSF